MMINSYKNWLFFFAMYFFTSSAIVAKEFTAIIPDRVPSIVSTNNEGTSHICEINGFNE